MRPTTFLLAIATIAIILSGAGAITGGWQPIENVNNEHVREIAQFAVMAQDMSFKGFPLRLVSVVRGFHQYVAGINYKLIVSAATIGGEGTRAKYYEAIVYENLSNVKELVSFRPLLTV
ncbi:unnamed protein product [Linum trigynum]|uniref:Cystatin domain-containing protein n=1 Tax=Linum trigynum TaxID=586398 RepID=A0AAV2D163_9ROSI